MVLILTRYLIKQNHIRNCVNIIRFKHENHYEVLNVKQDCSDKEIRESFVKLSKECHPDTNKTQNPETTARFTKIMEAYKILSRSKTRAEYDNNLKFDGPTEPQSYYGVYREGQYDPTKPNEYYGIRGLTKVSNWKIVLICVIFTSIGVAIQLYAISNSVTFNRDILNEKSKLAGAAHSNVRDEAQKYGNREQLERIKQRLNYESK